MTIDDLLEIEQLKYSYEQGYPLHRHNMLPELFWDSDETLFTIPSANDFTEGIDSIRDKFQNDLDHVSANEDSYHTGWQIGLPLIWEDEGGQARGIFSTFGHFVFNLIPGVMNPPYSVNATSETWNDCFIRTGDGFRIKRLEAKFLIGQPVWSWDARSDNTYATRKELGQIKHPTLGIRGDHYER